MTRIADLLRANGFIKPAVAGCSDTEIQALGADLPDTYVEFLKVVGYGASSLFRGTDIYYRQLTGLQEDAAKLMAEAGIEFRLPPDAFVFYMHQGWLFGYFRTSEGDDPPVYQVVEGVRNAPQHVWSHLSEFFLEGVSLACAAEGRKIALPVQDQGATGPGAIRVE